MKQSDITQALARNIWQEVSNNEGSSGPMDLEVMILRFMIDRGLIFSLPTSEMLEQYSMPGSSHM